MNQSHKSHAIVYYGPFETNFRRQKPGVRGYQRRDGSVVPDYRVPKNTTGLVFGLMEKRGKECLIVRIQAPSRDVCLLNPVPASGTGPNGTRLTGEGASRYLEPAIRANAAQSHDLEPLRLLLMSGPAA